VEAPGLGELVTYRTTKELALLPGNPSTLDLGISQLVRLKKRIPRPHETRSAVYRITVKGDKDAASAFAEDSRQVIKNAKGDTFEMHIKASRGPREGKDEGKVREEYLKSNYFINCDDRRVKRHARTAVRQEKDPWKKALRIEKWVHNNMTVVNDEGLATADHVAETLEGDCTEHAMLAAAMCRAQDIPSRTAVGLVYADTRRGPAMGFHMWTEVWVKGQWLPIDATLGRGYVGAAHIKILDHSWYDTRNLTPLLPFLRVVGKLTIEVVKVNG
jgi:transglutaminase-like putative cysteine protease